MKETCVFPYTEHEAACTHCYAVMPPCRCHVIEPPGILLDMPKPQPSPSHPPPPPPLRQQLISITPEMSTSTSKAAAVPTPQSPQSPAVATLLRQVTLLPPQQPPRNAVPNPKPATAPQVQPITPPTARAGAQQGQHAQHAQQGGPSVPSTAAPPTPSAPTAGADWFALYQRLYGPQHAPSTPTAPYSIYSIQMTPQQPQFLAPPTTHLSSFPQGPGASLQGLTVGVSAPSGNRPSPPTMQRPHAEGPTGPAVRRHPPPPPPPPPVPPLWLWQAAMAQGPQGFTMVRLTCSSI